MLSCTCTGKEHLYPYCKAEHSLLCIAVYEQLFSQAIARMQSIGGQLIQVDFEPFVQTARLLYESAFVAERYSGIRSFLESGRVSKVLSRASLPQLEGSSWPRACKASCLSVVVA